MLELAILGLLLRSPDARLRTRRSGYAVCSALFGPFPTVSFLSPTLPTM